MECLCCGSEFKGTICEECGLVDNSEHSNIQDVNYCLSTSEHNKEGYTQVRNFNIGCGNGCYYYIKQKPQSKIAGLFKSDIDGTNEVCLIDNTDGLFDARTYITVTRSNIFLYKVGPYGNAFPVCAKLGNKSDCHVLMLDKDGNFQNGFRLVSELDNEGITEICISWGTIWYITKQLDFDKHSITDGCNIHMIDTNENRHYNVYSNSQMNITHLFVDYPDVCIFKDENTDIWYHMDIREKKIYNLSKAICRKNTTDNIIAFNLEKRIAWVLRDCIVDGYKLLVPISLDGSHNYKNNEILSLSLYKAMLIPEEYVYYLRDNSYISEGLVFVVKSEYEFYAIDEKGTVHQWYFDTHGECGSFVVLDGFVFLCDEHKFMSANQYVAQPERCKPVRELEFHTTVCLEMV